MEQLQPLDSECGWCEYMRALHTYWRGLHTDFILGIPGGARSAGSRHLVFLVDGLEGDAYDKRDDDRG